jgi:hypothetical protein
LFIKNRELDKFNYGFYLEGEQGQMILSRRIARLSKTPQGGLGFEYEPDDVVMIVTTKKYQEALQMLIRFENSAMLASAVAVALKELEEAVNNNASILIDVLNEKNHQNHNNYTQNDVVGSIYYKQ